MLACISFIVPALNITKIFFVKEKKMYTKLNIKLLNKLQTLKFLFLKFYFVTKHGDGRIIIELEDLKV